MTKSRSGFTIVELLIVIVVIAILAAITIVAFNGIQDRARNSAAQSAAAQAKKKLEVYKLGEGNGSYPTTGNLSLAGLSESDGYQYTSNGTTFCVTATNGNKSYTASDTSTPTQGGCAGHGQGGVAAITNLAVNPRATSYSLSSGQHGWQNNRWAGSSPAAATYSLVTGATDGPEGITTYGRKTWTTAPAAITNSGDTGYLNTSGQANVNEGDSISISCYLRPSVQRNFQIGVYQYTSSGAVHSTARSYGPNYSGPPSQWTRLQYTYTVPSGVSRISIACDSNASNANGAVVWSQGSTLDGTGLMVIAGTNNYSYADGSSPNWIWNGMPNNSTSTGPAL